MVNCQASSLDATKIFEISASTSENMINIQSEPPPGNRQKYDQYMVCDSPTFKGKEHLD